MVGLLFSKDRWLLKVIMPKLLEQNVAYRNLHGSAELFKELSAFLNERVNE